MHATSAIGFGAALAAAALVTPIVRKHAHRFGGVDHALTSRKVHTQPTPRLGGIAIVAGFFVPLAILFLIGAQGTAATGPAAKPAGAATILIAGAAIAALGIYDDVRGAAAKLKFLVQISVAGFAYAMGFRIMAIATPFAPPIQLGWLALPFTIAFVVGVINAINLIDGLDGLAGGVAFLAGGTFFFGAMMRGDTVTMILMATLCGAILGFLIYNFNPASIFMGDTGSMFLGVILALTAIRGHMRVDGSAVGMVAPVIALGIPIADTLLSMVRRAMRGVPLFRGDRGHIHHKLLARGLSTRGAALVLYAAAAALGAAALLVRSHPSSAVLVVAVVAVCGVASLHRLGYLEFARLQDTLAARQRNLRMRRNMAQVGVQLRRAENLEDVWSAVKQAVSILDARWVSVELVLDVDGRRRTVRMSDGISSPTGLVRSRHGLLAERPEKGFLELLWPREQGTVGRDAEIEIEMLCERVRVALEGVVERTSRPAVVELAPRLVSIAPPASAQPRLVHEAPASSRRAA